MIILYSTGKQTVYMDSKKIISIAESSYNNWGEVRTIVVRQRLSRGEGKLQDASGVERKRTSFLGRSQMPSSDRLETGIWHQNTCDAQGSKRDL